MGGGDHSRYPQRGLSEERLEQMPRKNRMGASQSRQPGDGDQAGRAAGGVDSGKSSQFTHGVPRLRKAINEALHSTRAPWSLLLCQHSLGLMEGNQSSKKDNTH